MWAGQSLRNMQVCINWKLCRAGWKLPALVIVFRADVLYWRRWQRRLCDRTHRSERRLVRVARGCWTCGRDGLGVGIVGRQDRHWSPSLSASLHIAAGRRQGLLRGAIWATSCFSRQRERKVLNFNLCTCDAIIWQGLGVRIRVDGKIHHFFISTAVMISNWLGNDKEESRSTV